MNSESDKLEDFNGFAIQKFYLLPIDAKAD